ncbi:CaiB/BaiF CoA transferase family protein [Clostridium sp.]|uniref:CaiB/BaiF CoA transferase family protein n=1 Tax=Clostridium sp. TaxID=1506 RepID=UPI003F3522C3
MGKYKMPLEGIKVLDFTQALAGVYCAGQLGDLGADIWKVERYGMGDQSRTWPPFINGLSALYASYNRNKRSISIDTAKAEGKKLVLELAKECDIVLENFKVGTMEKLGIGYDELVKVNPKIIYGSISGFGLEGPDAKLPCYDNVAAARGGLTNQTGRPDGPPIKPGYSICDNWTGLNLFSAILMALVERENTGKSVRVDLSMTDCAFYMNDVPMVEYAGTGKELIRSGNHDFSVALFGEFEAKDGYVVIATPNEKLFAKFCKIMNLEHLATDPKYITNEARLDNIDSLIEAVENVTRTMGKFEIEKLLGGNRVPCGAVMTIPEVIESEHAKEVGMITSYEQKMIGKMPTTGIPMHFSKTPGSIRIGSPLLGEHSIDILKEAGVDADAIEKLIDNGIVEVYQEAALNSY